MITVNINKAKIIAHEIRRAERDKEFAPYDALIAKQIPGADVIFAESQRAMIREKYAVMQTKIDNALTVDELKSVVQINV